MDYDCEERETPTPIANLDGEAPSRPRDDDFGVERPRAMRPMSGLTDFQKGVVIGEAIEGKIEDAAAMLAAPVRAASVSAIAAAGAALSGVPPKEPPVPAREPNADRAQAASAGEAAARKPELERAPKR